MTVKQEVTYLHNLVCGDPDACNRILNKRAFAREFGSDRGPANMEDWEKFETEIDPEEEILYCEWYWGPLAARGYFVAVNREGKVTKQKMLWLS